MSHTVQVRNIECKNEAALSLACDHLGLKLGDKAKHRLYGSNEVVGRAVQLPGWRLPVVINTDTGEASYDNYSGSWGNQDELDKLIQRYAFEAARAEATMHGLQCSEEALPDGGLKLVMMDYASS